LGIDHHAPQGLAEVMAHHRCELLPDPRNHPFPSNVR
jgi:hypothetical protein